MVLEIAYTRVKSLYHLRETAERGGEGEGEGVGEEAKEGGVDVSLYSSNAALCIILRVAVLVATSALSNMYV